MKTFILLFAGAILIMLAGTNQPVLGGDLETKLFEAADSGAETQVIDLVKRGAEINARNQKGTTPLMMAAANGHLEIVKALASLGGQVNARNNNGATALMVAAFGGHLEVVKLLLSLGSELNARTGGGVTALSAATEGGHRDVVALLKALAEQPAEKRPEAELFLAAYSGDTAKVQKPPGGGRECRCSRQRSKHSTSPSCCPRPGRCSETPPYSRSQRQCSQPIGPQPPDERSGCWKYGHRRDTTECWGKREPRCRRARHAIDASGPGRSHPCHEASPG